MLERAPPKWIALHREFQATKTSLETITIDTIADHQQPEGNSSKLLLHVVAKGGVAEYVTCCACLAADSKVLSLLKCCDDILGHGKSYAFLEILILQSDPMCGFQGVCGLGPVGLFFQKRTAQLFVTNHFLGT